MLKCSSSHAPMSSGDSGLCGWVRAPVRPDLAGFLSLSEFSHHLIDSSIRDIAKTTITSLSGW
jgi:hypothetical protein